MSNKAEDPLFALIRSMGKAEKRHFKVFSRKHVIGKENVYVQLFDAIRRQREYNEPVLKAQRPFRDFATLKNRLSNALLNSLEAYHKGVRMDCRRWLNQTEILYSRSLFRQAARLAARVKERARHFELLEEWLEALHWEYQMALKGNDQAGRTKAIREEKEVLHALIVQQNYKDMANEFAALNPVRSSGSVPVALEAMRKLLQAPALRKQGEGMTMAARQYYHDCYLQYYLASEDYENAQKVARTKVDLYQNDPKFIELNPAYYLSLINSFLVACTGAGRYEDIVIYLDRLDRIRKDMKAATDRATAYYFSFHLLNYCINRGEFRRGREELKWIEAEYAVHEKSLNRMQKIVLCTTIAHIYFGTENYKKSLAWLNKALSYGEAKHRSDIECFIRIFCLIVHMEMKKELSFLRSVHKSAVRFLKKHKRLFAFEETLLQFIKENLLRPEIPPDLNKKYSQLIRKISQIEKSSPDKHAQNYFYFSSWLEGRLYGKAYADQVRNQSNSQPG